MRFFACILVFLLFFPIASWADDDSDPALDQSQEMSDAEFFSDDPLLGPPPEETQSPGNIPPPTKGDQSSDELQQEINQGELSPAQAAEDIGDGKYDEADGGLYCPQGNCSSDPESIDQGF